MRFSSPPPRAPAGWRSPGRCRRSPPTPRAPLPRQSWLTCEETVETLDRPHGYVFDVPVSADGFRPASPITSMGRFAHEAVAVEPGTNIVYLTEDAGATSGFYRHVPDSARHPLAGGRLQMLKVVGADNGNLELGGATFCGDWMFVNIQTPGVTLAITGPWRNGPLG